MKKKILSYKFSILTIILLIINIRYNFISINNLSDNDKVVNIYNIILTFYLTFISISIWLFWVIVSMKETINKVNKINPNVVKAILRNFKIYIILLSISSIILFTNYIMLLFNDIDLYKSIIELMKKNIFIICLFYIIFLLETIYSIFHIFITILNKFLRDK